MWWELATKKQLLQIALYEDCSLDDKYEAARGLQISQWRDEYLTDLVRLWGEGKTLFQIAIELGMDEATIDYRLTKHGLYGRRIER